MQSSHLDREDNMAASGAHPVRITSKSLPKTYQSAVISFADADSAGEAFDVLGQGGQYGIVGRYTYVVTPHHISLLDQAEIHYDIQSYR